MVDGCAFTPVGTGAPAEYKGEFYVVDYNSKMKLSEAPLHALSQKSKDQLSQLLNGIKILPSEEGYPRDWRGLAHCAKVKSEFVTFLAERKDPTKELIEHWAKQSNTCKLSDLQLYLGQIDRWDVIDDTNESFLADAEEYVDLSQRKQRLNSQLNCDDSTSLAKASSKAEDEDSQDLERLLTEDDVKLAQRGLPPQQYHAYVLYADEDVEFATELIERMESVGLKLCEKSRDLLGGSISHDAILRLIRERCNRLIIIVSPAFLESSANKFFMTYAQALGIEQNRRKIVPCIYKKCILPPQLNFYFALHYENRGKLFNFWDKLQQSIQSPDNYKAPPSTVGVVSPKITITDINGEDHVERVREIKPTMFPPPAKLRSGSSMFDLRKIDETDNSVHLESSGAKVATTSNLPAKKSPSLLSRFRSGDKNKSRSYLDLTQIKSSNSPTERLMATPSPSSSVSGSSSAPVKKMKWYKKIMTPKEKSKETFDSGNVTPTSTLSLEREFCLPDGLEDPGLAKKKSKKKKIKLLAW